MALPFKYYSLAGRQCGGQELDRACRRLSDETFRSLRNFSRAFARLCAGVHANLDEGCNSIMWNSTAIAVRRLAGTWCLSSRQGSSLCSSSLMMRAPEVASRTEILEHVWDSHFDTETISWRSTL